MSGAHDSPKAAMDRRWPGFLLLAAGLVLGCGCGLSDYQSKMEAEQKLVKYWDEENKHLEGTPIKLPEKKPDDKDKEPFAPDELFLRPPLGISSTPDEAPAGIVYRYTSKNPVFQEMLVAVAKNEKKDKFVKDVLARIPDAGGKPKLKEVGQQTGRIVAFDLYHEDLPNQIAPYVYFLRDAAYQVAIAFRPVAAPAAASGASVDTPIDYSLASMVVGAEARLKHRIWRPPAAPKETGKRKR